MYSWEKKLVEEAKKYGYLSEETYADIILQQLGGNKFISMTGAKNFVSKNNGAHADTLCFKIPKSKDGINYVEIRLSPDDLYSMTFRKIGTDRKTGMFDKLVVATGNIQANQLQGVFTKYTGLRTHL